MHAASAFEIIACNNHINCLQIPLILVIGLVDHASQERLNEVSVPHRAFARTAPAKLV